MPLAVAGLETNSIIYKLLKAGGDAEFSFFCIWWEKQLKNADYEEAQIRQGSAVLANEF